MHICHPSIFLLEITGSRSEVSAGSVLCCWRKIRTYVESLSFSFFRIPKAFLVRFFSPEKTKRKKRGKRVNLPIRTSKVKKVFVWVGLGASVLGCPASINSEIKVVFLCIIEWLAPSQATILSLQSKNVLTVVADGRTALQSSRHQSISAVKINAPRI